jgi:hypothetical protein
VQKIPYNQTIITINATMPKLKEGKGREIFPIFSLRHAIFCGFGSGFVDNPFF